MKSQKNLEDKLYCIGWCFLIAAAAGAFIYFRVVMPGSLVGPCFFYHILGIYCPGCGGTRAVWALLHGKLLLSAWYHPLVPYTAVIFGGFMVTQTLERLHAGRIKGWKFHSWHLYGAVAVLTANWVLKNFLLHFCNISM